jgi:serine phosphatase RsbU (regulator of sigma subunit)
MTVQSYRLAAYSIYHFNLLKNIAINATIALTNSDYVRELDLQKDLIQKNHVNTLSSINAAKRIQDAILPMSEDMQAKIANFFIFYQPRDIVSGDFYWFFEVSRSHTYDNFYQIIVVGDCTGHGVPGAFMSMIGNNLLNDIVKVRQIVSPDQILNELRLGVHKALQQDKTGSKEGMDIVILAIEKNRRDKRFLFAGAMNPLFYVKNNEFFEIKGDKMPIGGTINEKLYQLHEIQATHEEKITFWLTTDGYQDQFGGKENKKFMVKCLKNLLFENVNLSLAEQKSILQETFEDWKGEDEQIDDVTILGFLF